MREKSIPQLEWCVKGLADKRPNGISSSVERIDSIGLKFGLWIEPESISLDSNLYRKHLDWCICTKGRHRTETDNKLCWIYLEAMLESVS